jgi:ketosteroid isomerase-like protein
VEIVRRATAATSGRDLGVALQFFDSAIEWVVARQHPNARTLRGHEELAEYQREWQEMLPDMHVENERLLDAGARVIAIGTVRGTGSGSGVGVEVPIAFLITVRDGLITHVEEYLDPAEPLKVVGLEH